MSGSSRSQRRVISREPPSPEVVDRFIRALQTLGYAERSSPRRARTASSFLDWTEAKEILWAGLTESHVRAYSKRPGHPAPSGVSYESRVLRLLLNHLRDEGITDTPGRGSGRLDTIRQILRCKERTLEWRETQAVPTDEALLEITIDEPRLSDYDDLGEEKHGDERRWRSRRSWRRT